MIPYYEFVDGQWQVSDDWRLYGVRGRPHAVDASRDTLPEVSQELAQEDAALDTTTLSSIQATMTSSYSVSATPTTSTSASPTATAASFSAPAGWTNDRERSIFYTVPLIIVASVLLFFSIFGIIGGVTIKRSRKKQLAKAAKAADVESAGKESSDFGDGSGKRPKFINAAKRKMKKTKARIVKGARRKPLVLVVPSEMISSARLTASALELRQAADSSGVLRQRTSLARQSTPPSVGSATPPVDREDAGSVAEEEEEPEAEALSPTNSRTALTNEDAESSRGAIIPRRRSLFSTLSHTGSASSSRRNSTVASPPAYRPANRAAATPSYAAATGSISPPVVTRTPRQTEKMAMQPTEESPEQLNDQVPLAEQEDEPVDRSLYVGHVATDDKAVLRQIHTLASAPATTAQADDGSAPILPVDEEGFEDHSQWLDNEPPPPDSPSVLPAPSQPIDALYTGHQAIASAPPMLSTEEEASAPPLWEEDQPVNSRREHTEV